MLIWQNDDIFDLLLDRGTDVNNLCYHQHISIMYAVVWGDTKCVCEMIQKGA